MKKYVADTSVIVERLVSKLLDEKKIKGQILIPNAVIAELEHQANKGQDIGFSGLEEIQNLRKKSKIEFVGGRPRIDQIKLARSGEIDALIIDLAVKENASLITADLVQAESGKAFGLNVIYFEPKGLREKLEFEKYFDDKTMSIHILEDCFVYGKKGKPGEWELKKISSDKLDKEKIQDISKEILEKVRIEKDSFVEISRRGSTIVQYKNYRIVIVRPPISDGWEITVVKPLKKLKLEDYKLSADLKKRLEEKARGLIIAGQPGVGKCHGKDTPILMYDGSIKMVQDVKEGNLIMGSDSKPRTVLSTTKGYGKLYRVKPVKGDQYIINEDHILSLKYNRDYKEKTINITVKDFLNSSKGFKERYKGYRVSIDFVEKKVPINPYFLGLWLGDGLSASPRIASADIEIINFLKEYAQEIGLVLKKHSNKKGICQIYGISTGKRGGINTKNHLINKMRELNLINNKHIPNIYKINSKEIRLQVLAGLLDSDGYLGKSNYFEITTKTLKDEILYLIRSLGFAAYSKEKIVDNKKYYRITMSGHLNLIPTKIKRKIGSKRKQVKNVLRTGITIESIDNGDYFGFELDNDGLYCLGDFTVTHNSTFAQALGEHYLNLGRILKTVESPRDLQLPKEATQYSKNFTTSEEIHDILFLSRPDNIIFDEMRDTPDFELYSDLRLAGSECIGVVHSSSPIDAVQRFIPRLDVGMIPSIIDTIIFVDKGKIGKILSLNILVKVPTGMTESDLARPIVEVKDFLTDKLEYEIYSYGDQTVVIPVDSVKKKKINRRAEGKIVKEIRRICSEAEVEIVSNDRAEVYVPQEAIPGIIGRKGKKIEKLERKLGIHLSIKELEKDMANLEFEIQDDKDLIRIFTEPGYNVEVYVDGEMLFSGISSKKGVIKVHKKSNVGRELLKVIDDKGRIELKGC